MPARLHALALRCSFAALLYAATVLMANPARGEELSLIQDVEFQPLSAQVKRVVEALEMLGQPLGEGRQGEDRAGDRIDRPGFRHPNDSDDSGQVLFDRDRD